MKNQKFDALFSRLKREGLIETHARPSIYRLFYLLGAGLLCIFVVARAQAQSQSDPVPAGNLAVLIWSPNATNENVTAYTVYVGGNRALTVSTNSAPLSAMLSSNGVFSLAVSARNLNGESALSTNIWVRYWANKPTPPNGLIVSQGGPVTVLRAP